MFIGYREQESEFKYSKRNFLHIYIYIYLLIEFNVIKLFFFIRVTKRSKLLYLWEFTKCVSFFGMQCVMCTPSTIGGCHSHWQAWTEDTCLHLLSILEYCGEWKSRNLLIVIDCHPNDQEPIFWTLTRYQGHAKMITPTSHKRRDLEVNAYW